MLAALRTHAGASIILRIDSSGGDGGEAFELAQALEATRGSKLAIIDPSCWSAAMLLAVACDRIHIRQGATMMLHQSRACAAGTADDLIEAARIARQTDERYLRFIASRRRASSVQLRMLIAKETFLGSHEAVALGLADREIHALPRSTSTHPHLGEREVFKRQSDSSMEGLIAQVERNERSIVTAQGHIDAASKELSDIEAEEKDIESQRIQAMGSEQDSNDLLAGLDARDAKLTTRREQCLRARKAAEQSIASAKISIAGLENVLDKRQAEYWTRYKQESFERLWGALKEPLMAAVVYAGAAEYHEQLHRGENVAAAAWGSVTADSLLETDLKDFLLARISEERAKLHDGISIDVPPKGHPRIRAVRSQVLSPDERKVIRQLVKGGQEPTAHDLASGLHSLAQDHAPTSVAVDQFDVAAALRDWRAEVLRLEEAIEQERKRKYADIVNGRPVNVTRCREERIAPLKKRLDHAHTTLKDIELRAASTASS
jgi:ATP-dependent protease ClpP protease subunit